MSLDAKYFKAAIACLLEIEGGYVKNIDDAGGETKYGISKRAYPHRNIGDLSIEAAKEIYYTDYWLKAGCDQLPWPLALIHFDMSVNCGVGRATEFYKLLLKKKTDPAHQASEYLDMRKLYYANIAKGKNRQFLEGWFDRIERVKNYIEAHEEIV